MKTKLNNLSTQLDFWQPMLCKSQFGYPGMPMGMADVATVLFKYHLRFNPENPEWVNRDGLFYLQVTARCFFIFVTLFNWLQKCGHRGYKKLQTVKFNLCRSLRV